MRIVLDTWFDLQNEWDENTFLSILPEYRQAVPRSPNGQSFYISCCIDTFKNLLSKKLYNTKLLVEVLQHCLGMGNIQKARLLIRTGDIPNDDILESVNKYQNLYLVQYYKEMFKDSDIRGEVWNDLDISGNTLYDMCCYTDYLVKLFAKCRDSKTMDILCLIAPPTRDVLSLAGRRVPPSWAYRVGITLDTFVTCVRYNVDIDVLDIIVSRLQQIKTIDVVEFMTVYPPSDMREKVFYKTLSIMKMSEYNFLLNYMTNSKRYSQMKKLCASTSMCTGEFANTCTLYGIDTADVPSIFGVTTTHKGGAKYLLDIREMKNIAESNTYAHPYTREILSSSTIQERYKYLLDNEIPTQAISYDDTDVPPSPMPPMDNVISNMIQKHDLSLYVGEMTNIMSMYGNDTLVALDRHPNIIRMYTDSLATTIVILYPYIRQLAKECI